MTGQARMLRCAWIAPAEDPDARLLIPGCPDRVQDWDAPCACPTTVEELGQAETRIAELTAELQALRHHVYGLTTAIDAHPDRASLFAAADRWHMTQKEEPP
ncbi:hypothetical protein [Bailinhaonella thermotolerans]|uniref:Uncharacterized protein n=1 Tax=Bailinhaonella thermotolerans TaxID=1070861 RepID=A0A3A3ZXK1_9ACTN|nr:hypothetical protein [Bailinhaonella thermotolerans]RJL19738.1 hypothetical protein D5H75_40135 [Bailinhaonella thermotolerans]